MIRNSIIVRAGCSGCGDFFDVDLIAIRNIRGEDYSLLDRHCTCRRTICRGRAYFVVAADFQDTLMTLVSGGADPLMLKGLTPADLEPPSPPDGPGFANGRASLARYVHHIARSVDAA